MRNGQNKRMRGRNRKSHNPLTRVYESNGPDVKIRGTASHIAEKYIQLARNSQTSGDPVSAENYNQHAEHYLRLIAAAQEQFRQTTPFFRPEGGSDMRDDYGDDGEDDVGGAPGPNEQVAFGTRDPQPYLPRDAQFFSPREQQQPYGGRHPQHQPQRGGEEDGNVERLPSFITGGGAPAAPQAGAPQGAWPERLRCPAAGRPVSVAPAPPASPGPPRPVAGRPGHERRRRRPAGPSDAGRVIRDSRPE